MKILFAHKFFPTQYRHLAITLAGNQNNQVVALTDSLVGGDPAHVRPCDGAKIRVVSYSEAMPDRPINRPPYGEKIDPDMWTAFAVYRTAVRLRDEDRFEPDIICANTLWGESLFLKEVFPNAKMLAYMDLFYHASGPNYEFNPNITVDVEHRLQMLTKNATLSLAAASMDWGVAATQWQRGLFPQDFQHRISVAHDGIDTNVARPNDVTIKIADKNLTLTNSDEIVTFAARQLERVRGFEPFLRAVPAILKQRPNAHILIIGSEYSAHQGSARPEVTLLGTLRGELGKALDTARVHFLGRLDYNTFISVLQLSSVHVYLTYPMMLSWSMLEAMSCGAVVVGSNNAPVTEVITDEQNGMLVDFFDPGAVANAVTQILQHPDLMAELGRAGRTTIVDRFDLQTVCLPQQLQLIDNLLQGEMPAEATGGAMR
jgi:glycosyltransferase involved in cell wall biosynthesis